MSVFGTTSGDFNQKAGMTLSEIAYAEPGYIPAQLEKPCYATEGLWSCKWVGVSAGNQMYVAQNTVTKQWAVVIRGTATDPLTEKFWIDWFQDLTTLVLEPIHFAKDYPHAKIAWGTKEALEDLLGMTDSQLTLLEFLQKNASLSFQNIAVMGHSLGGNLATVLSAYLAEKLCLANGESSNCIVPLTFAAPTSGNKAFCDYVQALFQGFPFRYWNTLDVVPHAWTPPGLQWIMDSYPNGPKIDDALYAVVDAAKTALEVAGDDYEQPGVSGVPTAGTLQPDSYWVKEAAHQHSGNTYLSMYGAPPVTFP